MKQFLSLLLLSSIVVISSSQKSQAQAPAGYKTGYVIAADGVRKDGFIKESFKSKASFVFQSADGKKITYTGNAVTEAGIDGVVYATYLSDFFKVISTGAKVTLYQKVSDASGNVVYNGSEVIGINPGTEGSINDQFIRTAGMDKLVLITKKNFEETVAKHCTDCPAVVEGVRSNKLNYEEIEKAVKLYNECR